MSVSAALAPHVVAAIRQAIGPSPAGLHEPWFIGNEWTYVKECLDSTYVSSVGPFVDRFERDLAAYTGARHAVAVANGTVALHMALVVAGVERDDEVLVPALTFVATAAAVVHAGAIPHFIDCEMPTLGADPAALRDYLSRVAERRGDRCVNRATGRCIAALVPMHTFGHPADIDGLLRVAADFKLALVEDAAESLGSTRHGRHMGTFGVIGTLSFNGNKTVTTGGGGALLTNDAALAKRAKHLTTTARVPHRWSFTHDEVGYNYRMPNINAALGCAQLEQLDKFVELKRRLFDRYASAFAAIAGVTIAAEPAGCRSNFWLHAMLLDEASAGERDAILQATNDAGFGTRPCWTLMPKLPPYRHAPCMPVPVAEMIERRLINLPSSPQLLERPR